MNTEEALRESLRAHADELVTGDPWPRVERAHRRSRRRRAAAAGALALLVAGGVTVGLTPWSPSAHRAQPADQGLTTWLDDGRPRGELNGPELERAVASAVRNDTEAAGGHLADDDGVRLVYAGSRDGTILALARAVTVDRRDGTADSSTLDTLFWLVGPDVSALRVLSTSGSGVGAPALVYPDATSDGHVLGVVPRGARVSAGRVTIDADGRVHRTWAAVRNDDGVVDLPVGEVRREGPVVLRVVSGAGTAYSAPLGLATTTTDRFTPAPLTTGRLRAATAAELGAGVADQVAGQAIDDLLRDLGATADVVEPKVLWAGPVADADVVAVAAGIPGQGRVLRVSGFTKADHERRWSYTTTIPAQGPVGALGWRVESPQGDGELVGWLFDTRVYADTVVKVDGAERTTSTSSGLGLAEVDANQEVTVAHDSTRLIIGPEARGDGGTPYAPAG